MFKIKRFRSTVIVIAAVIRGLVAAVVGTGDVVFCTFAGAVGLWMAAWGNPGYLWPSAAAAGQKLQFIWFKKFVSSLYE